MEHLVAARDAVAAGDHAAALRHLLAAWQVTAAAAIADAIDIVGARAAAGMTPPTGKTVAARNAAWTKLANARDPVMRGPLLASLTDINNFPGLSERIALLTRSRDPRVAQRLCDLIDKPVFSPTIPRHSGNWSSLWSQLAKLGDPRVLVRARGFRRCWSKSHKVSATQRTELVRRLDAAMPALEKAYGAGVPELAARDLAIVQAIVAKVAAPVPTIVASNRSEAALLAAIYAAPDDDGPRAVYADFLHERADPRGELITLQLASKRTTASRARERELLAEYATRWVEPLGVKKATVRFERGFVVACAVPWDLDEDRSFDDPAWATVREFNRLPRSDTGHATSLRVVTGASSDAIARLARFRRPLAIEELVWNGPSALTGKEDWAGDDRAAIAAWPKIRALPALRRLTLGSGTWFTRAESADQLAWLWRAPVMAAVEELTIRVSPRVITGIIARVATTAIRRFTARCSDREDDSGWQMIFERDSAGVLSRLTIVVDAKPHSFFDNSNWGDAVVAAIPTLPPLTTARVVGIVKKTAQKFANTVRVRLETAVAARGDVTLVIE